MPDELNTTVTDAPVTTEAPVSTPESTESRRDSLSRALDDKAANPSPNDATPAERARDDAGRFAAGKGPKPTARPVLTAKGITAPVAAPPVAEPKWRQPPKSWAKEHHEAWSKGDPDKLREIAFTREEQMRAGIEQIIPKAKFADQVDQALSPFMATIQTYAGGDKLKAIASLAKADHNLRTMRGPEQAQFIGGLLQSYGVDIKALMGIAQASPGVDVASIQAERATLKAENEALKRQLGEAEDAPLLSEIEKLAKEKPNFEEVRPYMAGVLRAGLAKTYPEAYEVALRLKPDLAPKAPQANPAEQRAAADKAAKSARAAAVSVRSATPGTPTQPKAQDRRSTLVEAFNSREGRL